MDTKEKIELAAAVGTSLLAAGTFWLAWLTRKLEKAWFSTSADQIGVSTWLVLQRRFDSREMKRARKALAEQLRTYSSANHDLVSETVLDFFEDVGTTYREGCLSKKLAESGFSFYACRWWEAAKAYVDHEQKLHKEDRSLFEDFRYFAAQTRLKNETIDHDELQRFLEDEMRLQ